MANSYKRGGRCVAGLEIAIDGSGGWKLVCNDDGCPRWIRPIAKTTYGEIPNHVAESINIFTVVKLYDIVPCPENAHTENVYYSHLELCNLNVSVDSNIINKFIDTKHHSIFYNKGRAVSAEKFVGISYSLMFIHPDKAGAYIDENREKSKNRMKFTYYGVDYDFPITDPKFLEEFKKTPNSFSTISSIYLTLSLGLEFDGWHHKLVAGVIIPKDTLQTKDADGMSYMEQQKRIYANAYAKWTQEDDERLRIQFENGKSISELTRMFGRNEGAIRSRINKLELEKSNPYILEGKAKGSSLSHYEQSNWFDEYDRELTKLLDKKNEIDKQINEVRTRIMHSMEFHGLEEIHTRHFSVSYTPARTVFLFDSRVFRTENEELYSNYCKPRQREASIIVKRNLKD